jgi:bisphosphoglycerate-independent phosphoglycerate mutase (AlkP superfamily)
LISAEDFENLLFDTQTAHDFTTFVKRNWNIEIEWLFSYRNQFEYFESLYNRLSDWKFPLALYYRYFAEAILNNGYASFNFHAPMPRCLHFIFDYDKFFKDFHSKVSSKVDFISITDIHKNFSGAVILTKLGIPVSEIEYLGQNINKEKLRINRSQTETLVEYNHVCTFLGREATQEFFDKNRQIIEPYISERINQKSQVRSELQSKFETSFQSKNYYLERI